MTEQMKWDIRIILTLMVFAVALISLSLGCEKKCSKGEVKIDGKCYVPGVAYLRANGSEKMV